MSLTDKSVRDLLAAFRSPDPAPGGGSASALAGAVGSALLAMVAGLPHPRAAAPEHIERLTDAGVKAAKLSDDLSALVDRDTEAYLSVIAAYKLPKGSDEEKRERSARIQAALGEATAVPLEVMRRCAAAIDHASPVATYGNRNAASDVQVALELLQAALRGARSNVEINLTSLQDQQRAADLRAEVARLSSHAEDAAAAARRRLPGQE
jgi:methenyltetrahydrofolate cyclohydrolase